MFDSPDQFRDTALAAVEAADWEAGLGFQPDDVMNAAMDQICRCTDRLRDFVLRLHGYGSKPLPKAIAVEDRDFLFVVAPDEGDPDDKAIVTLVRKADVLSF